MAQEQPNRFSEWLLLFRERVPILRERFDLWVDEARAEPRLIWATPAVRYATYALAAILISWAAAGVANSVIPPPPPDARAQATTGDFHVVCARESCGYHFVIHRHLGFRKFPVACPRCAQETGVQARKCTSPSCRGRWVAPMEVGDSLRCPRCGEPVG